MLDDPICLTGANVARRDEPVRVIRRYCYEAVGAVLCDLLAGVPVDQLRPRAASIMRQIERYHVREPGEYDE